MKTFLGCVLFISLMVPVADGADLKLKEKLLEAVPGSYLVLEQNKNFTFFYIHGRFNHKIILEEATIPAASCTKRPMNWKRWFESGAPGHTGWIISQINLETGIFEETFSFTHQGWVDLSDSNSFLTTLLNLRFYELTEIQRRHLGSASGCSKTDKRPLWNPRLIVDGKMIPNIPFAAYKARWPADRSELSRKVIEIYVPCTSENSSENPTYPTYFPYWLEVDGIGSAKVRVVDSGMDAHSPKAGLPKRSPQLLGDVSSEEDHWMIQLQTPIYYRDFMVVAQEENTFFGSAFPLPHTYKIDKKEKISLMISKEDFKKLAAPDKTYYFTITPVDDPSLFLQTRTPVQLPSL